MMLEGRHRVNHAVRSRVGLGADNDAGPAHAGVGVQFQVSPDVAGINIEQVALHFRALRQGCGAIGHMMGSAPEKQRREAQEQSDEAVHKFILISPKPAPASFDDGEPTASRPPLPPIFLAPPWQRPALYVPVMAGIEGRAGSPLPAARW